jgi:DNA-directed RNA polymerase II subunit RPB1
MAAATFDKIKKVQLGIWNPEEIRRGSVCEVLSNETYENNLPKTNGLFDLRMGTIERGQVCASCKQDLNGCPGHFGHIELARPVYHVHYFPTIVKLLRCVCIRCSKLLINHEDPEFKNISKMKGKNRFLAISQYCQKSKSSGVCRTGDKNHGCGMIQPGKYIKQNIFKIYAEFKTGETSTKKFLTPENILNILRNISDIDCEMLGFSAKYSRPEWMVCTVMPVPPPHVRPSVRQGDSQKREDDLTHKLADIVKMNKTLKDRLKDEDDLDSEKNAKMIDESTQLLQYHCATFIDNELPGLPPAQQRSGRPLKSLRQRLQAKEGRLRGNLMGKRCDFTGRSVISPDANIDIDELGVPLEIAMNLTYPEAVTPFNIDRIRTMVLNGPKVYPGVKSYISVGSSRNISLYFVDGKTINLQVGDVVNRHLLDGDIVLFNRQPSLHKMSMMGHRVRVLPKGSSFRLNVSVTSPYNADFDKFCRKQGALKACIPLVKCF